MDCEGLGMKFSMNGFRRQLSADIAELRELVRDSINMQLQDQDDLICIYCDFRII